jgi:hypothetical protein
LTDILVKLNSPGAEVNYIGRVPYYFRETTVKANGKQFKTPTRAATTVEFNSNSKLKEVIKISSDISLVEKTLSEKDIGVLLHGINSYVNINDSIDRHMSKMKYSALSGFLIRPQKKAKYLFASKKDRYEQFYDYSAMMANNTNANFWGLPFPHGLPIAEIKNLWDKYVIKRDSGDPYPLIFLDPSDEDFTAFQYLMPYLETAVRSGHIQAIGLYYSSPLRMQPIIRELITKFKDSDVAIITSGIRRESYHRSISGLHGQELFMSDIVALASGRWFPQEDTGGDKDVSEPSKPPLKAFLQKQLTVNDLLSLVNTKDKMEDFLNSVKNLQSNELSKRIINIMEGNTLSGILQNEEAFNTISNALRLHEFEKSGEEIGKSREFARKGEVRVYVKETKPTLDAWLHALQQR